MHCFLRRASALLLLLLVAFSAYRSVYAQSVWSGFDYSFTKAGFADPTQVANQDRITNNVWLTRSANQGIYNIHDEAGYSAMVSPTGTRWATDLNNPGKNIAAANWNNLAFTDWVTAYGGQGTQNLPNQLLTHNAVVYLISDNTYFDLQFTAWSGGGAFSYNRSLAPSLPSPTGDYNLNGVVDAADYVVWRDTLTQSVSPTGSGADGNANGTIDSGDLDFWRAHFGNILAGSATGSSLSAESVPEPASWALVLSALLVLRGISRASR